MGDAGKSNCIQVKNKKNVFKKVLTRTSVQQRSKQQAMPKSLFQFFWLFSHDVNIKSN
jgi:hypothetical protein